MYASRNVAKTKPVPVGWGKIKKNNIIIKGNGRMSIKVIDKEEIKNE